MDLYCFDFRGAYLGRLDERGAFFNASGCKRGWVGALGVVHDLAGHYLGRIDAQGSFFGVDGTCQGYVRNWSDRTPVAGYKPYMIVATVPPPDR